MIHNVYIDGHDVFNEFGICVSGDGLKQVCQYPAFKKLDTTDWPEEDGEEVDLTAPKLDSRTLQIEFSILDVARASGLFTLLSEGAYHDFYFPDLGCDLTLRLVQNNSLTRNIALGNIKLSFAEDTPVYPQRYILSASKWKVPEQGYRLDGKDLNYFGIYVLTPTETNLMKCATAKENLRQSSSTESGVDYDGANLRFKSKEVQLKLLMNTSVSFKTRFETFFNFLFQPGWHRLEVDGLGNIYDCYYKQMKVDTLKITGNGKIWCEFTVTVVAKLVESTSEPIPMALCFSTEDGRLIGTEDETPKAIEVEEETAEELRPMMMSTTTPSESLATAYKVKISELPIISTSGLPGSWYALVQQGNTNKRYNFIEPIDRLNLAVNSIISPDMGNGNPMAGKAQIMAEVVGGMLKVYGASKLLNKGYRPYLFRHCKRRNHYREMSSQHSKTMKGWHLFGSRETIKIENNTLYISCNSHKRIDKPAQSWSQWPGAFVEIKDDLQVKWGYKRIDLYKETEDELIIPRLVRLRFGIGFAPDIQRGCRRLNHLNLVSNLEEFYITIFRNTDDELEVSFSK